VVGGKKFCRNLRKSKYRVKVAPIRGVTRGGKFFYAGGGDDLAIKQKKKGANQKQLGTALENGNILSGERRW